MPASSLAVAGRGRPAAPAPHHHLWHPTPCGRHGAASCASCSESGWSEGLVLWDAQQRVCLGSVVTDIAPRRRGATARARAFDHDDFHFCSVLGGDSPPMATSTGDVGVATRFKVAPSFPELSLRAVSNGPGFQLHVQAEGVLDTCVSASLNGVSATASGTRQPPRTATSQWGSSMWPHCEGAAPNLTATQPASPPEKPPGLAAEVRPGRGHGDPSTVLVWPGHDAGRAILLAIAAAESARLSQPRNRGSVVTMISGGERPAASGAGSRPPSPAAVSGCGRGGPDDRSRFNASPLAMGWGMSPSWAVGGGSGRAKVAAAAAQAQVQMQLEKFARAYCEPA